MREPEQEDVLTDRAYDLQLSRGRRWTRMMILMRTSVILTSGEQVSDVALVPPRLGADLSFPHLLPPTTSSSSSLPTPASIPSAAHTLDARIQRDDEFSDSEDEGTGGRRDRTSHRENGFSKSKKASKTTTNTLLTSDLIPPSTRPPAPIPETIPGVAEGEDIELYEGPPATTSAARATTTAGAGEDDALGTMGDVDMQT